MGKDQPVSVKDTVYKLQLALLEGIQSEDQLFAAGSVMSRSDYEDVATERSITNLCGYPLCNNSLPSDHPHKGRYRISLKEHKVYDLQETYMFCSSKCLVNSRAYAGSLQEERCSVFDQAKLDKILSLFKKMSLDIEEMVKKGDLGFSNLRIQEKENTEIKGGEVSMEQWVGPSNAIEGYVPQRDRDSKPLPSQNRAKGSKASNTKSNNKTASFFNDMEFMSTIIIQDEYNISKSKDTKLKEATEETHRNIKDQSSAATHKDVGKTSRKSKGKKSKPVVNSKTRSQDLPPPSDDCKSDSYKSDAKAEGKAQSVMESRQSESTLKPSLKSAGAKKLNRSVTWADETDDDAGRRNLCEIEEKRDTEVNTENLDDLGSSDEGTRLRFESAEACASALSHAAEAVASGDAGVNDAMSEAGVIILPSSDNMDQENTAEEVDEVGQESSTPKWPSKPGIPKSELFDPEDSWFDAPPEGFSLTLSPFATMWMALFAWVTSSSIAYIYGRDESAHEEYLLVNDREYPRKITLRDGRSFEIKQTVEGCLGRACPGLVNDLRLSVPLSTLEQGMAHLLDTMSFVDAVPAFRMKQWQAIALLFIEALSVSRITSLTSVMTNRRMVLHKVLDGAQISGEEYELMKDLMLPLGRAPQFASQGGA